MSDARASIGRKGEIAVIAIDRPPVNALSRTLRELLAERLDQVARDETTHGLVVARAERIFVAGADIGNRGICANRLCLS